MLLDRSGLIADTWPELAHESPVPPSGHSLVPFGRLAEAVAHSALTIGVTLPNDIDLRSLDAFQDRIAMVSVTFPSFSDGRGFSIARRLRDRGFEGRLRASGPVVSDQFGYLLACGFDEVHVTEPVASRQTVDQWVAQLGRITLGYQQSRTGRRSIATHRRALGA